jgi:hypothetical protein
MFNAMSSEHEDVLKKGNGLMIIIAVSSFPVDIELSKLKGFGIVMSNPSVCFPCGSTRSALLAVEAAQILWFHMGHT